MRLWDTGFSSIRLSIGFYIVPYLWLKYQKKSPQSPQKNCDNDDDNTIATYKNIYTQKEKLNQQWQNENC